MPRNIINRGRRGLRYFNASSNASLLPSENNFFSAKAYIHTQAHWRNKNRRTNDKTGLFTRHHARGFASTKKLTKTEVRASKNVNGRPLQEAIGASLKDVLKGENQSKSKGKATTVTLDDYILKPFAADTPAVPRLSYDLAKVLFNPGVYWLQDPRSRVYNFDPYLEKIMPSTEFDFEALKEYITASEDTNLREIAAKAGSRYFGSSSSMVATLCHFHYLISQWRPLQFEDQTRSFPITSTKSTIIERAPTAIFLKWKNGTYGIDADKQFSTANILMMMGKSMEKLMTLETTEFEKYRLSNPEQISMEARTTPESFHYTTAGNIMMRSQLDAHDSRLPNSGMFDLKTRAVVTVRMNADKYMDGKGYEITRQNGIWGSFEREYYDMIRSAFLKYSLQVRMGRMDGVFVAFHNTERIFGFQYINLSEMDRAVHGQDKLQAGDGEFAFSLQLFERVLDKATAKFPNTVSRRVIDYL